jgi:hypothetical protein
MDTLITAVWCSIAQDAFAGHRKRISYLCHVNFRRFAPTFHSFPCGAHREVDPVTHDMYDRLSIFFDQNNLVAVG